MKKSPAAYLIVLACFVVGSGLLFTMWSKYRTSQSTLSKMLESATQSANELSAEDCINRTLVLHSQCTTLKARCDAAVPLMMEACLASGDRKNECTQFAPHFGDTHFGFKECNAMELHKGGRKHCGIAYRTIELFCTQAANKG